MTTFYSPPQPRQRRYLMLVVIALVITLLIQFWWHVQQVPLPLAGGITTVQNRSSRAFSQPAPGLTKAELEQHVAGDGNFDAVFVTAPAEINPGLGPLFNNASCTGCHLKDGRGMPRLGQSLVRVSLPQGTAAVPGGAIPVPNIGTQIRDRAIFGFPADAKVAINWQTKTGKYPDGTTYRLRSPEIKLTATSPQKPIPEDILTSLRVPPAVFGTGLLEAVPEKQVLALADPADQNKDGISGRPNYVWDATQQKKVLGRFGLKANTPNLLVQTAEAYHNDMGVTNPLSSNLAGKADIDRKTLEDTTFYVQTLGVPARSQLGNSQVKHGEKLFGQANCAACHIGTLKTAASPIPVLAQQTIHPYTDLLLHDLGSNLADRRPDFEASGSEWRTSPLWGLGLVQAVLPYSGYLHDGRARSIEEAILWHGGEAQAAQAKFVAMKKSDRQDLLYFLNSL